MTIPVIVVLNIPCVLNTLHRVHIGDNNDLHDNIITISRQPSYSAPKGDDQDTLLKALSICSNFGDTDFPTSTIPKLCPDVGDEEFERVCEFAVARPLAACMSAGLRAGLREATLGCLALFSLCRLPNG